MTKLNQVYRCNVCGNITEVVHPSAGKLVCCGKPMELLEENSKDAATEKHVPVIEKTTNGYLVKIGEVAHPMTEEHYIEWIELVTETEVYRKYLQPGEAPEAFFSIDADNVSARAYCNLHDLWKASV